MTMANTMGKTSLAALCDDLLREREQRQLQQTEAAYDTYAGEEPTTQPSLSDYSASTNALSGSSKATVVNSNKPIDSASSGKANAPPANKFMSQPSFSSPIKKRKDIYESMRDMKGSPSPKKSTQSGISVSIMNTLPYFTLFVNLQLYVAQR